MSDIVRPMQAMDIDRVYELEKTCFRTPWSRDSLAGELKNKIAHYLVLERDGVRYVPSASYPDAVSAFEGGETLCL